MRLVADEAGIAASAPRAGKRHEHDWIGSTKAASLLSEAPIRLPGRATIADLVAAIESDARAVFVEDVGAIAAPGHLAAEREEPCILAGGSKAAAIVAIPTPDGGRLGDVGIAAAVDTTVSRRGNGRKVNVTVERCGDLFPAGGFELERHADPEALTIPKGEQLDILRGACEGEPGSDGANAGGEAGASGPRGPRRW